MARHFSTTIAVAVLSTTITVYKADAAINHRQPIVVMHNGNASQPNPASSNQSTQRRLGDFEPVARSKATA